MGTDRLGNEHRPAGGPGGGRFAGRARTPPVGLAAVAWFTDTDGCRVSARYGVLDDAAEHVLTSGQCVSLAKALAAELGGDTIAVSWIEDEDDGQWRLGHAWAVAPDGMWWDVYGPIDRGTAEADLWIAYGRERCGVETLPADTGEEDLGPGLQEQNHTFAESIAPLVVGKFLG